MNVRPIGDMTPRPETPELTEFLDFAEVIDDVALNREPTDEELEDRYGDEDLSDVDIDELAIVIEEMYD